MSARLLILIASAAGLALYFALREQPTEGVVQQQLNVGERKYEQLIWTRELPGEEPAEEAEFDVTVRVDTSSGKNRLYFSISERHGYYVEAPTVRFWYSAKGRHPEPEDAPVTRSYYLDRYIPANGTLDFCFELVKPEIAHAGGDIGETGDWSARIDKYARARLKNPETFPPLDASATCY